MGEDMKLVKGSAPIDVTNWDWSEDKDLDELIAKVVAEGLTNTFDDFPPRLSLPICWGDSDGWGGKPPKDPATIYLQLHLNTNHEYDCRWSLSLADVIQDEFFYETIWEKEPYHASNPAKALAKRLRELADELENGPTPLPDIKDKLVCAECNTPIKVMRDARTKYLRPGDYVSNGDNMFPQYWHQHCWEEFTRASEMHQPRRQ